MLKSGILSHVLFKDGCGETIYIERHESQIVCHSGSCLRFVEDRSGIFPKKNDSRRAPLAGMTVKLYRLV